MFNFYLLKTVAFIVNRGYNKNMEKEIKCKLYDRVCIDCGECDEFCDLDPTKKCDSCGKCIEPDKNYKIIKITKIEK